MAVKHGWRDAAAAAAFYSALTVVFNWPLARGASHDIPGDFGDPLLNSWILAWDATHFGRGWWNANIFYPHPLALAYSEHLAAQAIQITPFYALTANAILSYNVLFLSTFVLSGLGMYLLARDLTNNRAAAMVAGMAYAFAPYRTGSLPHLQVLSAAWMPFVIVGFRRYFSTGRLLPLAGAAAAWLLQNLSCGYYLLFFSPIVLLYLAWEISTRRLWTNPWTLGPLALACASVVLLTVPFLLPYLELRRLGFGPRPISETQKFSADVYAYLTADPNMRLWGPIARAWPKAEGALFPGLTVTILALSSSRYLVVSSSRRLLLLFPLIIILVLLFGFSIRLPVVKITSLSRALIVVSVFYIGLLAVSRNTRRVFVDWLKTPAAIFTIITVFAIVMSFGPQIQARGRVVLDTNVYALFYRFVPGFDGLRVPARFGLIVALGLSALAALGVAGSKTVGRFSSAAAIGLLIAIESFAAPIPINESSPDYARPGLAPLPPLAHDPPPVYRFIASLPPETAIVELPLGEPAFDVRYMYYSTHHWKPIVNGYTGGQPAEYELLDQMLQDVLTQPERAWAALQRPGATHLVVHESFYASSRGAQVSDWARAHGARELAAFGTDRVFRLTR